MMPGASKLDLVPLALGARTVYQRAYGIAPPERHLGERLNSLAYSLARLGILYAIEGARRTARRLTREELARGYFRHGATELHFLDERAPIVELAVTPESIESAVDALRRSGSTLRSWSFAAG
jgi:hypothetical protein